MKKSDIERSKKYLRKKNRDINIKRGFVPLSQSLQNESRPPGWKSLAMAIVEQAVMDYCLLVRNGYLKELNHTGKKLEIVHGKNKRFHVQGIYGDMINDLLLFWKNASYMSLLNLVMYQDEYKNLDANMVINGLLNMEKIGNIYPKGKRI